METPRKDYSNESKLTEAQNSETVSNEESHTETTGTGFSEAERTARKQPDHGSQYLIDKYNVNDQAHSDSSLNDFIKTTSNFRHENNE